MWGGILSFAYGPMFERRRGLVIAPGLLHIGGHSQASPFSQTATLPKFSEEIEWCVIASFRIAESMGFKGDFRQMAESEIDHWKLSRLIPSAAGERHQTVL